MNPFVIEDFRQVYEAVALPVLVIDHETWRVLGVNAAALEQYGYAREEFVGLPVLEVRPPEGRADARRVMSEIPHGFWKTTVVQHMRKDGSVFSADVWSRDTVVDGRNVRIATIHEVTERLQIQQELQQAQKMEVVGRLAGGVAHDFNNALTAITGGLNLLLEDFGNDPDTRDQIEAIMAASERVALLTRGLMAFSRQQVMRAEICSPGAVVERSVDLLGHVLGGHIELRTRIEPDTWAVRVDPAQLEQVIMNLAVNAKDAMEGGGSLVLATQNVSVSREEAASDPAVPAGDYAVLSVEDTGHGMDEITRARVFEPFFTTKPPPEGTGLGLSVSYGIVRQSGGFIRVESAPGKGTTFRILLPRAGENPEEATPLPEAPGGGGRMVLVVDDDPDVRRFTCRVLRGVGYRAVPTSSPSEAVAAMKASEEIPVLLVASLGLPGRGGEELAERLQEAHPGLGVVFLASSDLEGDRLRAVSGGRQLLPRPFSVGTLTEAVRRVLNDS